MKRFFCVKACSSLLVLLGMVIVSLVMPATATEPAVAIDPTTGLPVEEEWKSDDWKDPERRLATVNYEGLPLQEVVRMLREEFKGEFDVLLPRSWQDPFDSDRSVAPDSLTVTMVLKNVTASEIFNAMNLVFQAENAPVRWKLSMNGQRPTALLRVLPRLVGATPGRLPVQLTRMIYFVGDLVDDGKSGGMTMDQLVKTVHEIYQMSYGQPANSATFDKDALQFHKEAQLLILTGTTDQIQFMQNTLTALQKKVASDHRNRAQTNSAKANLEEPKTR